MPENHTKSKWQSPASHWKKVKSFARQMRSQPTPSEARLWHAIRMRNVLSTKFRRQHAIDRFIVDFYAPDRKLVIEVDGTSHVGREGKDAERQKVLEELGCKVLRFTNEDVWRNLDGVLAAIIREIEGE